MSLINGKNFDPSFVCSHFSNNKRVLLVMIANEYGITREDLVARLLNCGSDERARVKQMLKEDDRRAKRMKRAEERKKSNAQSTEVEVAETVSPIKQQQDELKAAYDVAEAARNTSLEKLVDLEILATEASRLVDQTKDNINVLKGEIADITSVLSDKKDALASEEKKLEADKVKAARIVTQLSDAQDEVKRAEDELDFIKLQLEEVNSRVVFLIGPTYSGKLPDGPGRLISNVERPGVETEEFPTDIDILSFSDLMKLSKVCGIGDILELATAYEFVCLVSKYSGISDFEVHVVNEDVHIKKLLDWVMNNQ